MVDPDMPAQQLRLHIGELTASELRVARAAIRWANTAAQAQAAEVRREKEAVICLLYTDEVFVGTHWEAFPDADKGTWPQLCAHAWSYGADAEEIPHDQIIPLADLVKEFGRQAVQAWICHRRGKTKPDKGTLSEAGEKALAAIRALTDAAKGDRT